MNILFAFADDWGRYASAYRGLAGASPLNDLIETPHFDRIAREGVLFQNAFVPAPTCTPCRSALLSGSYFWQTGLGAILQGAVWDESIPTYPLELEKSGYHIGYTYKVWSPGQAINAPYGGARTRYEPAGDLWRHFSQNAVVSGKQPLYDEVRANFDAFLAARPASTPFCYWWGPTNTHRLWERGSGKKLWDLEPSDLRGRLPAFLPDVHEIREDVCDYLGECLALDAGLGVILEQLEATGELDKTLIVASGDHGIPGFPRAKCNLYDLGCEVALAARLPGKIPAGRVVTDFVNLMDLAPTFLEAAGVPLPTTMTARSLWPVLTSSRSGQVDATRTSVITGRERHVAAAREGHLPYPQRALRTAEFLYIRNFEPERWPMGSPEGMDDPFATPPSYDELANNTMVCYSDLDASPTKAWMIHHRAEIPTAFELGFGKRPVEELYALGTDPHYLNNLAADPSYTEIKAALSAQLLAVLTEQADPRVAETPCRFENPPYTEPHDHENAPIATLSLSISVPSPEYPAKRG